MLSIPNAALPGEGLSASPRTESKAAAIRWAHWAETQRKQDSLKHLPWKPTAEAFSS